MFGELLVVVGVFNNQILIIKTTNYYLKIFIIHIIMNIDQMTISVVISNKLHCSFCNYTAKDKSNFNKHIRTIKHINGLNQNKDISKQCEIYECEQCSKIYKTKQTLRIHTKSCSVKQQSIQPQTEKALLSMMEIIQNQNKIIEKTYEIIMSIHQQIKEIKTKIDSTPAPIVQNIYI